MTSLRTPRLRLSPLQRIDAAELFILRSDPQVMEHWDGAPDCDIEETTTIVDRLLRDMADGTALYWAVRLLDDGRFVGLCDLSELGPHSADLGFMIARPFWGQGLAYEACVAVLAEARRRALESVSARIHSQNERSARLLRRLGFSEIGVTARFEIRPGIRRDCRHFATRLHPA